MINDLRQWQHDKRVQMEVRRLAGHAADEIERLRVLNAELSKEGLEAATKFQEAMDEIEHLRALNAELVAALEEIASVEPQSWSTRKARAAIAKARG
jgi:hypothetical protein